MPEMSDLCYLGKTQVNLLAKEHVALNLNSICTPQVHLNIES